jgi:hypothetical protein
MNGCGDQFSELGLTGSQAPQDLWRQQDLAPCNEFRTSVPRHSVMSVRMRPAPHEDGAKYKATASGFEKTPHGYLKKTACI